MTININEVQEIIKNLESSGELSIKEGKYLKTAKLCVQLAAENVALKDINAWCKTDAFKNMYREFKTAESLGCSDVDCMHDAMLVAIMHAPATTSTDRIVAVIKADGVEEFSKTLEGAADICGKSKAWEAQENLLDFASRGFEFAKQLRDGGSHD
nr:MAG TPA: hypothetical protein [Caudoviricetes sp.]